MFASNAQIAGKVATLRDLLGALSPGETLSYRQMSAALKEKISGGSYILQRALAQAERETGAVFDNVFAVGFKRLAPRDMPGVGKKANNRIRRTARKTRRRFENVRANDLSREEICQLAAYRSHFGMLESLARESTVRAITVNPDITVSPADIGERLNTLWNKK